MKKHNTQMAFMLALLMFVTIAGFKNRTFPEMYEAARNEFIGYAKEYDVDTSGFVGPSIESERMGELLFKWNKRKNEDTLAELKVFVNSRRFSHIAVGSSGSQEFWKTLRHQGFK